MRCFVFFLQKRMLCSDGGELQHQRFAGHGGDS